MNKECTADRHFKEKDKLVTFNNNGEKTPQILPITSHRETLQLLLRFFQS